ncbi:MAG: hypothetical protein E6L09_13850 [Verrucomicrobia bacterium]|nr:MAG: hypothetical protein E6L09_13850 [Verrucomicrobiota bacterium]
MKLERAARIFLHRGADGLGEQSAHRVRVRRNLSEHLPHIFRCGLSSKAGELVLADLKCAVKFRVIG